MLRHGFTRSFIWRAFEKGRPVVLVSGCHIGDCHYINANHWTERRVKRVWKKMEKLGLRTERLGLEWISAAEGLRFQQVMEMERIRQTVTPEEIAATQKILKEQRKRKAAQKFGLTSQLTALRMIRG